MNYADIFIVFFFLVKIVCRHSVQGFPVEYRDFNHFGCSVQAYRDFVGTKLLIVSLIIPKKFIHPQMYHFVLSKLTVPIQAYRDSLCSRYKSLFQSDYLI